MLGNQARYWERELLKRAKEFQAKQPHLSDHILPLHLSDDGWCLTGNKAGRGWGGGRDRELDGLLQAKYMGAGYAGTRRANVESLA
jgi:hypothetical protein